MGRSPSISAPKPTNTFLARVSTNNDQPKAINKNPRCVTAYIKTIHFPHLKSLSRRHQKNIAPTTTTIPQFTMQDSRRRSSLLETLKSPILAASNDLLSAPAVTSSTLNSAINNNNNKSKDNPFQVNSSIWQNTTPSPVSDTTANPAGSFPNAPAFNRRASDIHPNYTTATWNNNNNNNNNNNTNNNNNSFSEDWNISPRKYSLDSHQSMNPTLGGYPQHQHAYHQQQQQQQYQQHNMQSALPQNAFGYSNNGSFSGGNIYEGIPSNPNQFQSNVVYPNESTPQLTQHYRAMDFYFNNDPYNRISINVDSLNNTTVEALLTQKSSDGSQITLPKFPNNSQLPSQQLFLVSFKSGRIDCFYLPESSSLVLKVNDLVIVEADRGKDLGKIVKLNLSIDDFRLLKYLQFMEQQAAVNSFDSTQSSTGSNGSTGGNSNSNQNVPTLHFPKPILRLALSQEIFQLLTKLQDEEKAKRICQFKLESSPLVPARDGEMPSSLPPTPQTSLSSSMCIIDAEYQFDRKKLIFYYKANHRIDFRDLVRDLFRIYKTRIWMCAVNSNQVIQSPPEEQTHLAQLNNIDMKTLTSPVLQQSSLSGTEYSYQPFPQQHQQVQQHHHQQPQQQGFQLDHFEPPQNDFSGFNQNIWATSSPPRPPQSSSNYYIGSSNNMNYNLPSSQSSVGHQGSIVGMMSNPYYSQQGQQQQQGQQLSSAGGNALSSVGSHSGSGTHSGSFSIWN